MTTAKVLEFQAPQPQLDLIQGGTTTTKRRRTTATAYKSNGQPKATAADPIRDLADITRIQAYYLERGNFRNYMMLTLGISFALRAGDLLSLTLGDVYNDNGQPKDHFYLHEEKTTKRRKVNITPKCRQILAANWAELPRNSTMDDPLFPSRERDKVTGNRKSITIQRLNQILTQAQKDLGISDHMSSHCMRKTHAYQTIKQADYSQEAFYAMQYKLNHSDLRVTKIYCGIEDDMVRAMDEQADTWL